MRVYYAVRPESSVVNVNYWNDHACIVRSGRMLAWRGLATYYVLFFLHLETRRVSLAGITQHPTETWMQQMARNAIDEASGYLRQCRYVLHDRDTKFCASFRAILGSGNVKGGCGPSSRNAFPN